jgi:hypothetical protein
VLPEGRAWLQPVAGEEGSGLASTEELHPAEGTTSAAEPG